MVGLPEAGVAVKPLKFAIEVGSYDRVVDHYYRFVIFCICGVAPILRASYNDAVVDNGKFVMQLVTFWHLR